MPLKWICLFAIVLPLSVMARPRGPKAKSPVGANRAVNLKKVGECRSVAVKADSADGENGTEPGENPPHPKMVYVIKQWHLAPTTVTKGFKEKYPQEKNQSAIYLALGEAIKKKRLKLVVAEGCEGGPIDENFSTAFNGWSYGDLKKAATTKGYERIITHVPLKLEAKFGNSVETVCGDQNSLVQEGNLRLSNLRGWIGFWTRLREPGNEEKQTLYREAAAELLKVPKTTSIQEILKLVKSRVSEELAAFRKSLDDRNGRFVETLKGHNVESAAIVVGGLHADDLRSKLEAAGFACEILEPPGYQDEGEKLVLDFERAAQSP